MCRRTAGGLLPHDASLALHHGIAFGGQPPTEQPIGAIIQQVSMWEIPAAAQ
jgi:hypothetical protein